MVECASDLTCLFSDVNDRFSSASTGVGGQFAAAGLLRGLDLGDLFNERELRDAARYADVLGEEDVFDKRLTTLDIATRIEVALVDEPGALGIYNSRHRLGATRGARSGPGALCGHAPFSGG